MTSHKNMSVISQFKGRDLIVFVTPFSIMIYIMKLLLDGEYPVFKFVTFHNSIQFNILLTSHLMYTHYKHKISQIYLYISQSIQIYERRLYKISIYNKTSLKILNKGIIYNIKLLGAFLK